MTASPIARGSFWAIAAAVLFGVATPLIRHFGAGVGAFATSTLLYAGAALVSGLPRHLADEPQPGRAQVGRVLLVATLGAALAPACLAWGCNTPEHWPAR